MNNTALLSNLYPVINKLASAARTNLLDKACWTNVPANTLLFDEAQLCKGFPFVIEGSIRVIKRAINTRELPLYRVVPGETCIISSSCLLSHSPYNVYGITESDTQLMILPAHTFEALLSDTAFRTFVFNLFAERITELMQLIEEVAFRKLDQRLAALLLRKGHIVHTTHQQLADELGSVREIVSRLLKGFSTQNLVKLSREQINILDPIGLERIVTGIEEQN